jgi:hypothetical protein
MLLVVTIVTSGIAAIVPAAVIASVFGALGSAFAAAVQEDRTPREAKEARNQDAADDAMERFHGRSPRIQPRQPAAQRCEGAAADRAACPEDQWRIRRQTR